MSKSYDRNPERASPWRAFSTAIFDDDRFRDDADLVAWMLMFGRYARSMPDGELKRGQFDCSMGELSRRFQKRENARGKAADPDRWNRDKVRAFCRRMKRHGSLAFEGVKGSRGITRFTIVNYGKWQFAGKTSGPFENHSEAQSGPITDALTPSNINDLEDARRTPDAGRTITGPFENQHRETGSKRQVLRDTITARGADPGGSGGEGSKRTSKPSVAAFGDWPAIQPSSKSTGFPYPDGFKTIWGIWRGVGKKNPEVKRQAKGKWGAYRLCLRWLHEGITPKQLADATREYLQPFYADPAKTHCKLPATLYSHANPIIPDYCDDSEAGPVVTDGRDCFRYAHSALRAAGQTHDRDAMPAQLWAQWDALPEDVRAKACEGRR